MGDRPAVALIPPLGETRAHFDPMRPALAGLDLLDLDRAATDGPAAGSPAAAATASSPGGPAAPSTAPPGSPGALPQGLRRTAAEDAERAARDLVARFGPGRPVVVVGASYGGLVARLLAVQPTGPGVPGIRLAGIVLVDSPHEYLARTMAGLVGPRATAPGGPLSIASDRVDLPTSFRQAGRLSAPGSLADVPLVVLARRPRPWTGTGTWSRTADRMWRVHQRMLLPLSTDAVYEEVTTTGYWICRDRPEVVCGHIRALVARSL